MGKFLVTGGAGFIGSNFVRYSLSNFSDVKINVLDKLTYAGKLENLEGVMDKINFIKGDICDQVDIKKAMKDCSIVFNFAAETHVDRSIKDPEPFIRSNIFGTFSLLEVARKFDIEKFVQVSTDEVYGSTSGKSFKETDEISPSSPYSASKASGDMLAKAYYKTYGVPCVITRSSNNYGPYQFKEKLIPVLITKALSNQKLPIYGDGKNVRDWIYVLDNCEAIELVSRRGKNGEIYNIASGNEIKNIEVAKIILKKLGKPESLIEFVPDRPGHDFRYSLDITKIKRLGWKPKVDFEKGIEKTIEWYKKIIK